MIPPCSSKENCFYAGQLDIFHALEHWFNFIPHSAQVKIISGLKKNTTIVAGRRFGKSKLMAALALYYALTKKKSVQFVISHSQDQSKIIFNDLRNMAYESEMVKEFVETTKDFPFPEISFKSGAAIYARSTGTNEGKYLRGHYAHRIIIDEAAFVKESVINNVISPMLADFDGDMIQISTPLGQNHFYQSFMRGERKEVDHASFRFSSFENPHISHDFINRERTKITDLQFRTEWMAEFVDDQVCVFKWESINDSLQKFDEEFERKSGRQYYVGVDIAKMHDYTCIAVIDGTDPKDCRLVYTERFNNRPYSFVVERILAIGMHFQPMRILLDETGVGAGLTEQVMSQTPIAEGFLFSTQSKIGLINTLKTGLEQRRIKLSEENSRMIDELRYYQYQLNEDTGALKMNAPSGKHDDMVIALALAYQKCAVIYGEACVELIPQKTKDLNSSDNVITLLNGETTQSTDDKIAVVW